MLRPRGSCWMSGSAAVVAGPSRAVSERPAEADRLAAWRCWLQRAVPTQPSRRGGRVLLISYQFPPTGGSGVQRPAKLTRYLPECGWEVEVLTAGHDRFAWSDPSLLVDVPEDTRVHRVSGREPACLARRVASMFAFLTGTDARGPNLTGIDRHGRRSIRCIEDGIYWRLTRLTDRFGLGDGEALWNRPAMRAALRRHRETPFDAVISTGPPHFVHRVAARIVEAADLPWIADVRDPLVSDFDRTRPDERSTRAMRCLERTIMTRASRIVTTCPSLAEDLRCRYPRRTPDDVRAITNGFDRGDVAGMLEMDGGMESKALECQFVAAGSFYGRREIARLVEPMEQVLRWHPEWRQRVRLVIAGTIDAEQRRQWEQRPPWLTLAGYIDHAAALRLAAGSACSIVVVPECEHGRLSVPGKTFELLALPTHVLALVPPGSDTERIVTAAGGATVASFEDSSAVAVAMERIVRACLAGHLDIDRDWDAIDRYDRRAIAAAFAECLEGAVTA